MTMNVDVHLHKWQSKYTETPDDTIHVAGAEVKWWKEPNESEPYTSFRLTTSDGAITIYGMDLDDMDELIANLKGLRGQYQAALKAYDAHKRGTTNAAG